MLAVSQLLAMGGIDYLRRRAATEDEGRFGILILTAAAALTSLGAIVLLLANTRHGEREPMLLALAIVTILLSWAFIHVIFAVHYANEYYAAQRRKVVGMVFPKEDAPDYWDFLYFSFVVGMTSQVSDVAVASKSVRRIVLAHGIVSFLFNVTLAGAGREHRRQRDLAGAGANTWKHRPSPRRCRRSASCSPCWRRSPSPPGGSTPRRRSCWCRRHRHRAGAGPAAGDAGARKSCCW